MYISVLFNFARQLFIYCNFFCGPPSYSLLTPRGTWDPQFENLCFKQCLEVNRTEQYYCTILMEEVFVYKILKVSGLPSTAVQCKKVYEILLLGLKTVWLKRLGLSHLCSQMFTSGFISLHTFFRAASEQELRRLKAGPSSSRPGAHSA